jgi:hypothetical protein
LQQLLVLRCCGSTHGSSYCTVQVHESSSSDVVTVAVTWSRPLHLDTPERSQQGSWGLSFKAHVPQRQQHSVRLWWQKVLHVIMSHLRAATWLCSCLNYSSVSMNSSVCCSRPSGRVQHILQISCSLRWYRQYRATAWYQNNVCGSLIKYQAVQSGAQYQ